MAPRTWTTDQFRRAVNGDGNGTPPARSMKQVTDRLGLHFGGPTNQMLRDFGAAIGVSLPNYWRDKAELRKTQLEADLERTRKFLEEVNTQ